MSGSGPSYIDCHDRTGKSIHVMVIVTPTHVEIGGWTFNRADLLRAMDVIEKAPPRR